jgi:PASTA domain
MFSACAACTGVKLANVFRPFFVAAILAAFFIAACGTETKKAPPAGPIVVPDVRGKPVRTAERILAEHGLKWRYKGSREVRSAPVEAGYGGSGQSDPILDQQPRAGVAIEPSRPLVLETPCTRNPGCG